MQQLGEVFVTYVPFVTLVLGLVFLVRAIIVPAHSLEEARRQLILPSLFSVMTMFIIVIPPHGVHLVSVAMWLGALGMGCYCVIYWMQQKKRWSENAD